MRFSCFAFFLFFTALFLNGCSSDEIDTGAPAPESRLVNQNGQTISLSKYLGQNVVLFFFGRTNNDETVKHVHSFENEKTLFTYPESINSSDCKPGNKSTNC